MTSRWVFGLVFLVCAALLGVAFYMEHVMGLEPCPLCWLQRFGFMGAGLVSFLAFLQGPTGFGVRIYGFLLVLTSGAGLGIAGRQLWLQSLPADRVPACGPSVAVYYTHLTPPTHRNEWPLGCRVRLPQMKDRDARERSAR